MAQEIMFKSASQWTSAWRAGPLEPGCRPYALNAVGSFFKVLDAYVPDEEPLSLTQVISKYEHCGRIFENEGKMFGLSLGIPSICGDAILGNVPNVLGERLERLDSKVCRMSVAGLWRLLEASTRVRLEAGEEANAASVFCIMARRTTTKRRCNCWLPPWQFQLTPAKWRIAGVGLEHSPKQQMANISIHGASVNCPVNSLSFVGKKTPTWNRIKTSANAA